MSNGHRFIANHADERTLKELCSDEVEQVGRTGSVKLSKNGKNLFAFGGATARL